MTLPTSLPVELRVVILGAHGSGKWLSTNTILGRKGIDGETRIAQCVKTEGEVAGRKITVVEAPSWLKHVLPANTPEFIKQEIILSSSRCDPGPHIILLVKTDIEEDKADQKHLELLGEGVWEHTIVLFIGDQFNDSSFDDNVACNNQNSQWLEKCGNRWHVINKDTSEDMRPLTQLIKKMDELVVKNKGHYYAIQEHLLQESMKRRKEELERAEERQMRMIQQRNTFKYVMGKFKDHILT